VKHTAREGDKTRITDLNDLKHRIRTEWAKLDRVIIAAAVRQWRRRLSACTAFNCDIVFLRQLQPLKSLFTSRIEQLIFWSDFHAVSYDTVRSNAWRSLDSQGKVVTLFRCSRHVVVVWFCITLTTFSAKITTIYSCSSKLCLFHYRRSILSGHGVKGQTNGITDRQHNPIVYMPLLHTQVGGQVQKIW